MKRAKRPSYHRMELQLHLFTWESWAKMLAGFHPFMAFCPGREKDMWSTAIHITTWNCSCTFSRGSLEANFWSVFTLSWHSALDVKKRCEAQTGRTSCSSSSSPNSSTSSTSVLTFYHVPFLKFGLEHQGWQGHHMTDPPRFCDHGRLDRLVNGEDLTKPSASAVPADLAMRLHQLRLARGAGSSGFGITSPNQYLLQSISQLRIAFRCCHSLHLASAASLLEGLSRPPLLCTMAFRTALGS